MNEFPTFVTHLECGLTGKHYPADQLHGLSEVGRPLLVRYDLDALKFAVTKEDLAARAPEFWRYREFLPVRRSENVIRLGEVMTPLVSAPALQSELGCGEILVEEEGRLPTGSFKARGLALAVSMAKELDVKHMAMPTNGNAGASLAAYCACAGIRVPQAVGDFLILRGVRESDGFATAVDDEAIEDMRDRIARTDGILMCPEGAATLAALEKELASGRISRDEKVVSFNCATGLKYPLPAGGEFIDLNEPVDYGQF